MGARASRLIDDLHDWTSLEELCRRRNARKAAMAGVVESLVRKGYIETRNVDGVDYYRRINQRNKTNEPVVKQKSNYVDWPLPKLTPQQRAYLKKAAKRGVPRSEMARKLGIGRLELNFILIREGWDRKE